MEWHAFLLLFVQSIGCLPWWTVGYLERASWDMKDKLGWITLKYEPAGYVVQLQFDNECKVKDKYEYFNNTMAALMGSNGIGPDEGTVMHILGHICTRMHIHSYTHTHTHIYIYIYIHIHQHNHIHAHMKWLFSSKALQYKQRSRL